MPDYSKDSLTELGPATDADLAIHGEEMSIIEDLEREVSQEVDGMTADRWDNGTRWAICDSSNFHHCLEAIEEMNKK